MRAPAAGGQRVGELQGRRAGFVSRVLADAIDLAILWALWLAALLAASVLRFLVAGPPFGLVSAPPLLGGPVSFAIGVVYLGYFWAATGRSPGKQVLGLRVVAAGERPLGTWRALLRAALCLLFPAGLLWALVSRRNASVQDLVLRTAVAYDWANRAPRRGRTTIA
jgi:uncharacterized RDD family membrane protein YckC